MILLSDSRAAEVGNRAVIDPSTVFVSGACNRSSQWATPPRTGHRAMIEWSKLTDPEVDNLDRNLPVILPIGLIEAHGAHIESGLDALSATYFARRVCELTGAIFLPPISYGFADTTWEYASTVGVKAETLGMVIGDICSLLCHHGFKKVIVLSGHGGNGLGVSLGFNRAWEKYPDLQPVYWTYYGASGVSVSHADETETSIALAIGAIVHMERAKDFVMPKLWHDVSSRRQLAPTSGAVNGRPTLASVESGQEVVEHVVSVLAEKVKAIIEGQP
jgi:creatinine amidohydrolase